MSPPRSGAVVNASVQSRKVRYLKLSSDGLGRRLRRRETTKYGQNDDFQLHIVPRLEGLFLCSTIQGQIYPANSDSRSRSHRFIGAGLNDYTSQGCASLRQRAGKIRAKFLATATALNSAEKTLLAPARFAERRRFDRAPRW
jgi:hypothetical protein